MSKKKKKIQETEMKSNKVGTDDNGETDETDDNGEIDQETDEAFQPTSPLPSLEDLEKGHIMIEPTPADPASPAFAIPKSHPTGTCDPFTSGKQTSIKTFFSSKVKDNDITVLDYIADRIGEKIQSTAKPIGVQTPDDNEMKTVQRTTSANDLTSLLSEIPELELIGENDCWVLRCKHCFFYLSNPIAASTLKRKPSGNSLAFGLNMSAAHYMKCCNGNSAEWQRLKHRVLKHLSGSSKTHTNSSEYLAQQKQHQNRQRIAIRNQLRTAIGVVQTKWAAVHYETRLAELYQAGADIGDFGHSRILFPQMISFRSSV